MHRANDTKNLSSHTPRNFVLQGAHAGINLIIYILLIPYLIQHLGMVTYSLVPLAIAITGYMSVLVSSFVQSVARFLMIDLQVSDNTKANRTFNTALFSSTGIVLISIPLLLLLALSVPVIFDVPAGQSSDSILLFAGVLGASIIDAWGGSFNISMFVRNRLDIYAVILIVQRVSQAVFILALFTLFDPGLSLVGLSYLASSMLIFGLNVLAWKKLTPQLRIDRRGFDRGCMRDMGGMTTWIIISQVGVLLFMQMDLIIVNLFFGSVATTKYSVALQLSAMFRILASVTVTVLSPMIIAYYANGMFDEVTRLLGTSIKLLALAFALPIGLLCGLAPEVLSLWVGPEFAVVAPLLFILTFHLIANLAVLPLNGLNTAFNKVRVPGLVTLGLGLLNIPLAIVLSLPMGWGLYGVAIAGTIMFTMKSALFSTWYAAKVIQVSPLTFIRPLLPGMISVSAVFVGVLGLKMYFSLLNWQSLILVSGIIALVYLGAVWLTGLNQSERELILGMIPRSLLQMILNPLRRV